jgi:cytochrome P450
MLEPSPPSTAADAPAAARCPFHAVSDEFKPFDLTDPFPFYAKVRAQAPVFFSEELGYWVVSRFNDVRAVFDDWQTFSAENAQTPLRPWSDEVRAILKAGGYIGGSGLSARTPPTHTRIRKAVSSVFGPRRFAKLEPMIRARAQQMIAAFKDRGQADLVADLAYELPAYTIFRLVGVPDQDVREVKRWAESRALLVWGDLSPAEQVPHAHNLVQYWNYCEGLVRARHECDSDDLPGDLVRLQKAGTEISDAEIAGICWSLLFAGHETTTTLIGNTLRELLLHRDQWQALITDAGLIPNAVEEVLRYSPSIVAWRRKALRDVQVGGQSIRQGEELLLLLGSANRDEERFDAPEQFDIRRSNARQHTSFGYGIHFCLGAPLARLQVQIVLQELTLTLPGLELVPQQSFRFVPNTSFRAPLALKVQWDIQAAAPVAAVADPRPCTLRFEDAHVDDEPGLGGKCASLVRLIRAGAPVPPGFAITTQAYEQMLSRHGLAGRIEAILASVPEGDVAAQADAAQAIHAAFVETAMPAPIRDAIAAAYQALCEREGVHDELPVAVRSSATAEDLPDASFAGQQDTYLWVVGAQAVIERVRDCWASLFTARAIGYRNDRAIAHMGVQMSVAVQKMVDAQVAGVAMSLDPLNGDRSRIVVDASWGLGESVVSGEVTPDHYAVDKVLLSIVQRQISHKAHEVVADVLERCTVHRAVPADRADMPCLSDAQILAVARMAKQLDRQFGGAQDIEWAIEKTTGQAEPRLLLLQCRPETVWSQKKKTALTQATGLQGLVNTLLTPVRIQQAAQSVQ